MHFNTCANELTMGRKAEVERPDWCTSMRAKRKKEV